VATHILAHEGHEGQPGLWREFDGNVQDWLIQSERSRQLREAESAKSAGQAASTHADAPMVKPSAPVSGPVASAQVKPRTKLSYKEQRELDELPARIEALETEQAQIRAALADGSLFVKDAGLAQAHCARDAEIEAALMQALERWDSLSSR
jgi:ABC transport system ATP-binding/permease protein